MKGFLTAVFLSLFILPDISSAWSGNYVTVRLSRLRRDEMYCALYFLGGCLLWKPRFITVYYTGYQCSVRWTHNGDQNCVIPICVPSCENGSTCVNGKCICDPRVPAELNLPDCSMRS